MKGYFWYYLEDGFGTGDTIGSPVACRINKFSIKNKYKTILVNDVDSHASISSAYTTKPIVFEIQANIRQSTFVNFFKSCYDYNDEISPLLFSPENIQTIEEPLSLVCYFSDDKHSHAYKFSGAFVTLCKINAKKGEFITITLTLAASYMEEDDFNVPTYSVYNAVPPHDITINFNDETSIYNLIELNLVLKTGISDKSYLVDSSYIGSNSYKEVPRTTLTLKFYNFSEIYNYYLNEDDVTIEFYIPSTNDFLHFVTDSAILSGYNVNVQPKQASYTMEYECKNFDLYLR